VTKIAGYDRHVAQLDADIAQRKGNPQPPPLPDGVVLVSGADLTPEPVCWLWPHWLALGKLHILAGAPGQGKTTIVLAMAATVTVGGRWPDGSRCEPGNVLIWSGEDDPADTLLPRLIAAGADRERCFFVTGARVDGEVLPFDPARDLGHVLGAVDRIGGIKLLMVDPVVSAVTGDSHKNSEVRRALQPLVELAAGCQCAVVGVTHFAKGGQGQDPTQRVVGSVAFAAVARVVMVAAKVNSDDGKDTRILARSKSNIGPDDGGFEYCIEQVEALLGIEAARIAWGKAVEGTARELLTDLNADADDSETSAIDEGMECLIRILGRDTVPSRDATLQMKAEGFSEKTIRNARERLGIRPKRSGFGKQMVSYWKLPERALVPSDAIDAHSCPASEEGMNGHEWKKGASVAVEADTQGVEVQADEQEVEL
jgi:putative DNA primase/helicase